MIKLIFIYFSFISIFAVIITITDKRNAIKNKRRIPEDFLLTIGLIGGALAEFITMKVIHHKTRHKKFMIGLPIEIIVQTAAAILIYLYR